MFDIDFTRTPRKQRRSFLETQEVVSQEPSVELARALARIKSAQMGALVSGRFWRQFLSAFRFTIFKIILLRVFGTGSLLIAILASSRILGTESAFTTGAFFVGLYLLFQCAEVVAGATARRMQQEAGIGIHAFFTGMVNAKLVNIDHYRTKGFSSGNLKILVSSDTQRLADFLITMLWNVMPVILCFCILSPFIILRMGRAGAAALLVSFLTIPLLTWLGKYTGRQEGKMKIQEDRLATVVGEWVGNVRLLRYMGWQTEFRRRTAAILRRYIIDSSIQHIIYIICFGVSFVWWLVPIAVMLATAHLLAIPLELKVVFSTIWMLNHLQGFIKYIPNTILKFNAASACVERLERLLNQPDFGENLLGPVPDVELDQLTPMNLILEDVTFGYNGKIVIENLSITFNLRQATSIIGTVGSGKTTLLRLLSGDLKPDRGKILVEYDDGRRFNMWHENVHAAFRSFAAYVAQEPYLSNSSLAGNINLAGETESLTGNGHENPQIISDLYFAGLEADVATFQAGLGQEIGENGINLSGGQKQRVNLARGFHSGRKLLFLDDPLSAVDTETEGFLMDGIFHHTRAFIMVSHRLSELNRTDRLLILENGAVVDDGPPEQVRHNARSILAGHLNGWQHRATPKDRTQDINTDKPQSSKPEGALNRPTPAEI